jgi:uncharacterized protein YodC (DUF2158 family)
MVGSITIARRYVRTPTKGAAVPSKSKYKTGDIVRLKSGGPGMTVEYVRQDGQIYCHWFAGNKLEGGSFSPEAIDLEDNLDPLKKKKQGA